MTKKEAKVMRSFQVKVITQLGQGTFESVDLKNPIFSRWLVGYMADNRIPFQVVHLGEGVTRIIRSGSLCENCGGKGFIEADNTPLPDLKVPGEEEKSETGNCCGDNCSCENGCKNGGECCSKKSKAA